MKKWEPDIIPVTIDKEEIDVDGTRIITKVPNNLIHPSAVRMYRTATRRAIKPESDRKGNWVQPFQGVAEYVEMSDISTFIKAQFGNVRRIKGLIEKCKTQ